MIPVAVNYVVSFRYIMMDHSGVVLEDTMNARPVSYLHGGSAILSRLQAQMAGLRAGDNKLLQLEPDEDNADAFSFSVRIDAVRPASAEEILLGYPVQPDVQPCHDDCDCYLREK